MRTKVLLLIGLAATVAGLVLVATKTGGAVGVILLFVAMAALGGTVGGRAGAASGD